MMRHSGAVARSATPVVPGPNRPEVDAGDWVDLRPVIWNGAEATTTDRNPRVRNVSDIGDSDAVLAWAMVEASPDALVMVDEHGVIELVNRQTEVLFGCDRGELLGHLVEVLLPGQFAQIHAAHRTSYRVAPEVRSMGSALDLLARRADGTEFPVEVSLSPIRVGDGLRVIAAVRDISERVAAAALDLEIRHGLDVIEDGVFMFDAETLRFRYVNSGAVDQTGYTTEELLTMSPLHLKPEFTESSFRDLLHPVVTGEVPSLHFKTVHRHKDGTDLPVEIVLQTSPPEPSSDVTVCVAFVRDIRDRLEQEREMNKIRHRASVADDRERMRRDMHDNVIGKLFATGMNLQATLHRIEDPIAQQRLNDAIDDIDATIKEIRTTVYGLRSQADSGCNTRGVILEIAAQKRGPLGFEPRVHLVGAIDELPDLVVDELLATLREALTNVMKYARATSVGIDLIVTDRMVHLTVTDDGVGFEAPADSRDGDDGEPILAGHGLHNLHRRAQLLGGHATISSFPDEGTTIDWTVPLPPDLPS